MFTRVTPAPPSPENCPGAVAGMPAILKMSPLGATAARGKVVDRSAEGENVEQATRTISQRIVICITDKQPAQPV